MWRGISTSRSLHALSLSAALALVAPKAHSAELVFPKLIGFSKSGTSKAQRYRDCVDRLVRTVWGAGTGLGFSPSNIALIENRVRSAAQWAMERELPMPTGFSINVDADAGFVIGGRIGAELVFLVPEEGNVQVGLFSATDVEAGAEATVGVGVGVSLIFNMEKVEEMAGPIVGASTEIRMLEGVGASILIDVESEELVSLKNALRAFAFEDQQAAIREIQSLITKKRVVAIGAEMEWGVGGEVSVAAGWRTQFYSVELPSDPSQMNAIMARVKRRILRQSLKNEAGRNQFKIR